MKALLTAIFFSLTSIAYCQEVKTGDFGFCDHKSETAEVISTERPDTNLIRYKNSNCGHLVCVTLKSGVNAGKTEYRILDMDLNPVATVTMDLGQMMIKYKNPYKVTYVKGMKFSELMRYIVEVDKRLSPS